MRFSFAKAAVLIACSFVLTFCVQNSTVLADNDQKGIALKDSTTVYSETDQSSQSLKDYPKGSILRFKEHSDEWYIATVYINHEAHTGYIHKGDIERAEQNQDSLEGRANGEVNVTETPSSLSSDLKSYNEGSILKYKSFSENWYEATVYINYESKTGYIHKDQVETAPKEQENFTGIAGEKNTNVYASASSDASVLKSYSEGTILQYKSYLDDWFEAQVYLNGEKETGYIHKDDVETGRKDGKELNGVGLLASTSVYSDASTNSKKLKTYPVGANLKYEEYSSEWYKAQVYLNGEKETGYIHKDHVEKAAGNDDDFEGIGLNSPTVVFEAATTHSNELKTYKKGNILKYKSFSENWYEATVYMGGQAETGYIHKQHVENKKDNNETLNGLASSDQSQIYERAADESSSLKQFEKNDVIKLKTFSNNWYEVNSYEDDEEVKGFMKADDISLEDIAYETTNYNRSFEDVMTQQNSTSPPQKSDGTGIDDASEEEIEYYLNADNFNEDSDSFYQFLVLSQPAGLNAESINDDILYNAGTLSNTADSFVEAGERFDVNEAYLISHALHETSYGASELAEGIPVNGEGEVVKESEAEHTVYNMYGIGAVDAEPVSGGALTAFEKEWFSPEEAIVGGAEFAADQYVNRGQDTLYKMKWNPDSPTWNQYATHVAWADIQTKTISDIYDTTEDYVLTYDVPKYQDQPSPIEKPDPSDEDGNYLEYPENIKGEVVVNDSNLNLREEPDEESNVITGLPNETTVDVKGTESVWLEIEYEGETGWAHSDYIKTLNLLEVTIDSLNVRTGPSVEDAPAGAVGSEDLIAGELDKDSKLVTDNEWYQIEYNGDQAWVSSGEDNDFIIEK
ncbi:SH3 domain-containing protein [Halobacillus sp. A5]|uniref:SH3 domain-containing protein n=1 Tax=Halobacillus sp. A5 TaxID=2880263 RepID=UPI0020A6B7B5|nr:SH3 domain-containing protein [Halobacillus sp. A5]MCP3028074.1 SH3 domain-containing protein [Halobacillus sp. A5]